MLGQDLGHKDGQILEGIWKVNQNSKEWLSWQHKMKVPLLSTANFASQQTFSLSIKNLLARPDIITLKRTWL